MTSLRAGLADVGRARPELQEAFELGVLVAVGGVDGRGGIAARHTVSMRPVEALGEAGLSSPGSW